MTDNKSTSTPTSLYPRQRAIVEAFAAKTNRSFSNAVQFIIEDWQRLADPEGELLKPIANRPVNAASVNALPSKRTALSSITGLRKGVTA